MKRYNIFYQVHKGLRAMLYETAIQLQQTDFSTEEETNAIADRISEVVTLFNKHADSEDNYILSAAESFSPSVATMFSEEHVKDHELSNRLVALVNMLNAATLQEEKEEIGSALRLSFTEFLVFNLQHMAKEENELNKLLWNNLTDEQLHGITMQIIAHIPGDMLNAYNHWMMRGLSNKEIIKWMMQVKDTAPDAVFNGMMELAGAELPEQRFLAITESLTEGAMLF